MISELPMALTATLLALLTIQQLAPAVVSGQPEDRKPKRERKPWERLLQFKGGLGDGLLSGGGSKAPKGDRGIKESAYKLGQLGDDWLKFAKEQFAKGEDRVAAFDDLVNRIQTGQLGTMDQAQQWAMADRERYENVFQPLQDKLIDEANNYDSAERQDKVAAEAVADVRNQASLAKAANQRQMAGMGVNPNSGRFQAANNAQDTNTALAAAGASQAARETVRQQGTALRANAVNMGANLPNQAVGNASLGLSAGGQAIGAQGAADGAFLNNLGIMSQGYQGAMSGHSGKAGVLGNLHSSNLNAWGMQQQADAANKQGMMQAAGTIGGALIMASSKDYKTDKKKTKGSLDKVNQMPVEEWRYKEGIADGGQKAHVGPYAEDFNKATGLGDGKGIPMQDAIGLTMGAVQELSKKVDKLDNKKRGKANV